MDDENVYLTICDENTRMWQAPLLITSTIMIFLLVVSCGATYILHIILDPIKTMNMSRFCFPACLFDSIWPQEQDQKPLHGPILHFVLKPSQKTFEESNQKLKAKTGYDMIHLSIKHGYSELIEKILKADIGEGVNLALVKKALMDGGDCKVIKMILDAAKKNEDPVDIDKELLHAVMKQLPYTRGMLISHKLASLSMSASISKPSVLWNTHM